MVTMDTYRFNGRRVLVRVDFNVPLDENGRVTDDTRMVTALPTIRKILADGGSVVVLTHLGRPRAAGFDEKLSVQRIRPHLEKILGQTVHVAPYPFGDETLDRARTLKAGEVMMLENLRFHPGEEAADPEFAAFLASLGQTYVNNAFGTAHRAHASTFTIAAHFPYDRMFGYLVENEIRQIDRVLKNPARPFTAILGGSKVSTKIHLIEALLDRVDDLIIGGGTIFTFAAARGGAIGSSLVEPGAFDLVARILKKARECDVRLHLPEDCMIADRFSNDAAIDHRPVDAIPDGWMGLDIGVKSAEHFARVIEGSQTILWNGPLGAFEMPHFGNGTLRVAMAVARATDRGAFSLVGGGDTIAAVNRYSLGHKMSYISTAGGALLEYIEGKKLPSIRAIRQTSSLDDVSFNHKRAVVRVDFNVPLDRETGEIADDTRIVTAIPTLRKVLARGGSLSFLTHLGRPDKAGSDRSGLSTRVLVPRLEQLLETSVRFCETLEGEVAEQAARELPPGGVLLMENLRFHSGETRGDEAFARSLARLGDCYINDAFGTAHRAHASTYTMARFFSPDNRFMGYLVESEISHINRALHTSRPPFTAIVGGSKVSTKIDIIEALMDKVTHLVIGGGIVYTFAAAMGGRVGASLVEENYLDVARRVVERARRNQVTLVLPEDCLIADRFDNDAEIRHAPIDQIPDGWMGLDIGVRSFERITRVIEESQTILWNGPMGVFEMPHFAMGTLRVAMAVARATDKGAYSLVGGGDSIAALKRYGMAHKVSYVSTAGGALLEYIEGRDLPTLKAIRGDFS